MTEKYWCEQTGARGGDRKTTLLVWADWAEEYDKDYKEPFRFLAQLGFRPFYSKMQSCWIWFKNYVNPQNPSYIGVDTWERLEQGLDSYGRKTYTTFSKAVFDGARALGWKP